MDQADLMAELDQAQPENNKQLQQALLLLSLVALNNPDASQRDLMKRPSVAQAFAIIAAWLATMRKLTDALGDALPDSVSRDVVNSAKTTIAGFTTETNPDQLKVWQANPGDYQNRVARLILRMTWLVDWLRSQAAGLITPAGVIFKRWVSRLDAKTCSYCRGLHGTIVPVHTSFQDRAREIGYTRLYGGLYAPPLHPRCRCRLEYVGNQGVVAA